VQQRRRRGDSGTLGQNVPNRPVQRRDIAAVALEIRPHDVVQLAVFGLRRRQVVALRQAFSDMPMEMGAVNLDLQQLRSEHGDQRALLDEGEDIVREIFVNHASHRTASPGSSPSISRVPVGPTIKVVAALQTSKNIGT